MLTFTGKIILGLLFWGFVAYQVMEDFRDKKPRRSLHT